jgi:glycosyltransferase involved in cell wall biosynthesis
MRISFLITHYNRPKDVEKCIEAILLVKSAEDEIVVSDDGSALDNITQLKDLEIDTLVKTEKNLGLAANINRGLQQCKGDYILYCQEDFILSPTLKDKLPEFIRLIDDSKIDLIRFSSYFDFYKVENFNDTLNIIPRFSFSNFTQNFYRYSDHPFLVSKDFHPIYGYYLEQTSGRYGETEYAIRISNSTVVIAITQQPMAHSIDGSESTLINEIQPIAAPFKLNKGVKKYARAVRMYFEWIMYHKSKRGLITYKNGRKD